MAQKFNQEYIKLAHKGSSLHKEELLNAKLCGCFHCKKTFLPTEIKEWVDDDDTALCPKCGIDSVLGSNYPIDNKLFLSEMHRYWFS